MEVKNKLFSKKVFADRKGSKNMGLSPQKSLGQVT